MMNAWFLVGWLIFALTLGGGGPAWGAAEKALPLQLDVTAGFGFDSNVSSRPLDADEDIDRLRFGKSDYFYEHNLTAGYTYQITPEFGLLAQYSLNQNFHFRLGQFDMFSNNVTLTPVLRLFNNSGQVAGLLNYNYLDIGSSKYRVFYTARPVYFQMVTDNIMLETSVGFERRYYSLAMAANEDNPSAKNIMAYLGAYLFLNKQRSAYVQARFTYDSNFAAGSNWDYDGYRILVAGVFPIVSQVTGKVYFDLYNQYFNNYWFDAHKSNNPAYFLNNPPFPKREDHGVSGGAQVIYTFLPQWSVQTNFYYMRNNSNIKWYRYDQWTINLLLGYRY